MKLSSLVTVALAATGVAGSSWFSNAAYNNWHETELERWLSDHDIPYPAASDRKDLEKLVQKHWSDYVVSPYNSWSNADLGAYLQGKGVETKNDAAASKDTLLTQVKASWYETEDKADQAWANVKDWILDTWTDSQLKEFCDKHDIPVPQPRKRDTVLQKARSGYDNVAKSLGEASAYPGNWLYQTWTESDLKEWLDTNGFPAPQPSTRDKLVASVRRNSRLAYLKMQDQAATTSASVQAAYATLTDKIIDAWSESDLKDFCDKNNIPVPQGTKVDELRALVRKNRANFVGDTVSATASSLYGSATSNVGSQYSKATDSASLAVEGVFNQAVDTWSDSRLKSYLDARGIPVPHASKTDELRALVRKNSHKAASGWNAWTYDDFSYENLKKLLADHGDATAKSIAAKSDATREELVSAAQSVYSSASSTGGSQFASVTSYLTRVTDDAKNSAFETWSESELKSYLDSYGIPVPQPAKTDELRAYARKQYTYFRYGTTTPQGTILAKVEEGFKGAWKWAADQFNLGADAADKKAKEAEAKLEKVRTETEKKAKEEL